MAQPKAQLTTSQRLPEAGRPLAARGALESEADRAAQDAMAGRQVRIDVRNGAAVTGQGGRRLEAGVKATMERRFRHDFSGVRVHDGAHGAGVARAHDALAVTQRGNIFFAPGAYRPHSAGGALLLAHELAHTIQGARVPLRVPQPPAGKIVNPAKLDIEDVAPIDYFEFVRTGGSRHVSFTSSEYDATSRWRLFDAQDMLVDDKPEFGAHDYDMTTETIQKWVDTQRAKALGTWTLRYEKGPYYAQRRFGVAELNKPPALGGNLTDTFYSVRELPGPNGKKLGTMTGGRGVPVKVINKTLAPIDAAKPTMGMWYHVILLADAAGMKANSQGWIYEPGVQPVMPWAIFKQQLEAFEQAHQSLQLSQRITMLRQMGHEKKLPFDDIIGVPKGAAYRDTPAYQAGTWQLLGEAQYVEPPGGTPIAMDHLFAGLDALRLKNPAATYWGFALGENWSAATWAGDIGSAAADAMLGVDEKWEEQNGIKPIAREKKLVEILLHYYETRAPDEQLLADIDSWQIDAMADEPQYSTVQSLLAAYYEKTVPARRGKAAPAGRKGAFEKFYNDYGLKTMISANEQLAARAHIVEQVKLFAKMWIRQRALTSAKGFGAWAAYPEALLVKYFVEPMTYRFLDWLHKQAKTTGAKVE